MADDKIWLLVNEFVVNLEETFYTSDIEFNSEKCEYIFYEIAELFLEKNKFELYRIELYKYTRKCFGEIDQDGLNDCSLFYDNLNILLELDFITIEDIEKLKTRINNQIVINNKNKELTLSNIS